MACVLRLKYAVAEVQSTPPATNKHSAEVHVAISNVGRSSMASLISCQSPGKTRTSYSGSSIQQIRAHQQLQQSYGPQWQLELRQMSCKQPGTSSSLSPMRRAIDTTHVLQQQVRNRAGVVLRAVALCYQEPGFTGLMARLANPMCLHPPLRPCWMLHFGIMPDEVQHFLPPMS